MKAPYNFAPISEKVYFPEWSPKVSQDVPFSDGVSGEIEFTIEACSPIFIRNAGTRNQDNNVEFNHLIEPNGEKKYFIPGTSIKGMIRNVLEIMSFSKLDRMDDTKYALRDLKRSDVYTLIKIEESKNIQCGWLERKDGKYVIYDHGKPLFINQEKIDAILGTNLVDSYKEYGRCTTGNGKTIQEEAKFARYKYSNIIGNKPLNHLFSSRAQKNNTKSGSFDPQGQPGTLVFTGQPSVRDGRTGKKNEFVFPDIENPLRYEISDQMWKEFRFHYFDHELQKRSKDWAFWKDKLNHGEKIPVFFRTTDDTKKIKDFGLTFLYKMPYKNTVKQARGLNHSKEVLDLSETIFGRTSDTRSLKGRAQFSHAFAQKETVRVLPAVTTVLGSPKASYYPIYIQQKGSRGVLAENHNYATLNNDNARISGWKRYPVHSLGLKVNAGNYKEKVLTEFQPLDKGARFTGKIRFHNLRKIELGALLSALTWHNHPECFHTLGMAKPLGAGTIKLNIEKFPTIDCTPQEAMKAFETEINTQLFYGEKLWHTQPPIVELFAMARLPQNDSHLQYMDLKDFANAKGSKDEKNPMPMEYLDLYSNISKIKPEIKPLSSFEDVENRKNEINRLAWEIEQKQEAERLKKEAEEKEMQEALKVELERKNQEERQKQKEERKKKLREEGLIFLAGKKDINSIRGRMDDWIRGTEADILPEKNAQELFTFIQCHMENPKFRERKELEKPFESAPLWKKISSWTGEKVAKEWHIELNKKG